MAWTNRRTLCLVALVAALCAGVPSYFIGLLVGYLRNDVERGDRDVERVQELIAAHPEKFGSLKINRGPVDKFHLEGAVKTQQDLDFLSQQMVRLFGEQRANYILEVTVYDGPNPLKERERE